MKMAVAFATFLTLAASTAMAAAPNENSEALTEAKENKLRGQQLVLRAREAEKRHDYASALEALTEAKWLWQDVAEDTARVEAEARNEGQRLLIKATALAKSGRADEAAAMAEQAEKLGVERSAEFNDAYERARAKAAARDAAASKSEPRQVEGGDAVDEAHGIYAPSKVKSFLAKKGPCAFWVLPVHQWPNGEVALASVLCVWDGVSGRGTIKESSGCVLGFYSVRTDSYAPLLKEEYGPNVVVEGKKCSAAIAMQLLNSRQWPSVEDNRAAAVLRIASNSDLIPGGNSRGCRIEVGGTAAATQVKEFASSLRKDACPALGSYGRDILQCP
jgi:hypothetical protein